ncbi:aldo/keto reductase [candidate division KSB3 bacterium]|uniref:Aldo/keto reductase n=1 Tax=candidate division KSB3 bacterium TaxID=2044937 RepID=A0A9D5JUI5_9BACT|nr:aldo/keto reductase [candidate division KSB3 bacterium]MBD3324261.1 aldo/keto reductase [candidate division KSB3 bacterium]
MEYTHLGRTGLLVSKICLGTVNFGPFTPEAEAHAIMDRALELGINFFDTANVYGQMYDVDVGVGTTEEIIGRWLAQGGGRREKIVLATKLYRPMGDWPNESKLSAYHIKRACEESLRRLQTDHIDLYQMHHVDYDTPWEEIWQAMEQLVREGKIIYVGSSNFATRNIVQANCVAQQRNFLGLVSEQSIYSLRNREIELEVIPACKALGLGVLPWSPLGGGILCGAISDPKTGRRGRVKLRGWVEKLRPQLDAYEALCREIGLPPADVALAWVLSNPGVTSPILGPRTVAQLEQNVKALDLTLSAETLATLDEIWPGPGGQAPQAYAW